MAKTYIDTVKYIVHANVLIGGLVEKPDVVGAVFGQTEGLLGDDLDLRDLQKNGRIGRIEVELSAREGKTNGIIKIPSSLDMVETCIVAAALEVVDRVGPCEASFKVNKVEDTRNLKRKILIDRAKNLLKTLVSTELPESREISEMVRDEVKTAEIVEYGIERLPAGPNIDRLDEIILVEGRADVINLLKNDLPNAIAIEGARVPQTIVKLSKEREVTVFLDGDRGGDIILNELIQGGVEIDYIARAPAGKEVEELTRKELIKCIRGRVPFEQQGNNAPHQERYDKRDSTEEQESRKRQKMERVEKIERVERKTEIDSAVQFVPEAKSYELSGGGSRPERAKPVEPVQPSNERIERLQFEKPLVVDKQQPHIRKTREALVKELDELNNTLKARFYDNNFERTKEVQVRDVIKALEETRNAEAIVFDGIITQRLVDLASNRGVKLLIGVKIGNVSKTPEGIEIVTKTK